MEELIQFLLFGGLAIILVTFLGSLVGLSAPILLIAGNIFISASIFLMLVTMS